MEQTDIDHFEKILQSQLKLANECNYAIVALKKAVEEKKMDKFNSLQAMIQVVADKMEKVEQERVVLFSRLMEEQGHHGEEGIYTFVQFLADQNQAERLLSIYCDLRKSVAEVQSNIWIADAYFKAASSAINSIMDISPAKRAGLYGNGKHPRVRPADNRTSIVINYNA